MPVTWEQIFPLEILNSSRHAGRDLTQPEKMWRTPVPGGWLVYVAARTSIVGSMIDNSQGSGLTFVPDPEHKWEP
jgi:hypothetical protein